MANMQGLFVPNHLLCNLLSLWPQSTRALEPILLCYDCTVANVNHETRNDAAYHATANYGSLQIHKGKEWQKNNFVGSRDFRKN